MQPFLVGTHPELGSNVLHQEPSGRPSVFIPGIGVGLDEVLMIPGNCEM